MLRDQEPKAKPSRIGSNPCKEWPE